MGRGEARALHKRGSRLQRFAPSRNEDRAYGASRLPETRIALTALRAFRKRPKTTVLQSIVKASCIDDRTYWLNLLQLTLLAHLQHDRDQCDGCVP